MEFVNDDRPCSRYESEGGKYSRAQARDVQRAFSSGGPSFHLDHRKLDSAKSTLDSLCTMVITRPL
jgi:hypothetical protein